MLQSTWRPEEVEQSDIEQKVYWKGSKCASPNQTAQNLRGNPAINESLDERRRQNEAPSLRSCLLWDTGDSHLAW